MFGEALFSAFVYSEITPQTDTLPNAFMLSTAASSIFPPTLSKYMSIPSGKYLQYLKQNHIKEIIEIQSHEIYILSF
jgi:hypothetical protein